MFDLVPKTLSNLFSKAATRPHPFVVREPFKDVRGELVNDIEKCIFCGMCSIKCPSQCITIDKNVGTWECDPFACVYCGVCVEICPTKCLSQKLQYRGFATEREKIKLQGTPKKPKKKEAAE